MAQQTANDPHHREDQDAPHLRSSVVERRDVAAGDVADAVAFQSNDWRSRFWGVRSRHVRTFPAVRSNRQRLFDAARRNGDVQRGENGRCDVDQIAGAMDLAASSARRLQGEHIGEFRMMEAAMHAAATGTPSVETPRSGRPYGSAASLACMTKTRAGCLSWSIAMATGSTSSTTRIAFPSEAGSQSADPQDAYAPPLPVNAPGTDFTGAKTDAT